MTLQRNTRFRKHRSIRIFGGDPNTFFASNCIISHNYYPVGNPGSWIVSQLSAGELDNLPYYLYIKADKAHGGALFLLSLTKNIS